MLEIEDLHCIRWQWIVEKAKETRQSTDTMVSKLSYYYGTYGRHDIIPSLFVPCWTNLVGPRCKGGFALPGAEKL
jgi:hypothetical protein